MWHRHFVVTTPALTTDNLPEVLFPGRRPTWYVTENNVRIALENEDDFRTTYDVYVGGHYDRMNDSASAGSVVWDIGANLGVASLIFAQNPKVSKVYAYEPMPHTFACAVRSLSANSAFAPKINLENLGVGKCDRELQVSYTLKAKAAIGLADIPSRLKTLYNIEPQDMEDVTIHLTDAAEVLRAIRTRHPGAPILLKLDAEGAEYEIVDRLIEAGVIQEIAAAAIEWHNSPGEKYLTSRLHASGFETRAQALEADGSIGMIDAWR
jgi:FkbM family methyltransferase